MLIIHAVYFDVALDIVERRDWQYTGPSIFMPRMKSSGKRNGDQKQGPCAQAERRCKPSINGPAILPLRQARMLRAVTQQFSTGPERPALRLRHKGGGKQNCTTARHRKCRES